MRVRLRKWEEIRPVRGNAEVFLQMWAENQCGVRINSKGNVHILYAFKDDFSVWSYCCSAYSGLKGRSKQVTRQTTETRLSGFFMENRLYAFGTTEVESTEYLSRLLSPERLNRQISYCSGCNGSQWLPQTSSSLCRRGWPTEGWELLWGHSTAVGVASFIL